MLSQCSDTMGAPDNATRFTPHVSRRALEILAVTLVLLLAAYLRFNHLEWTEFKQDEAHLSQLALDMARHGQIPLTGIGSSVGIVNPPLAAWLLAIPYAVSASPIVATAFIAGLNVLAVAMCYVFGRKLFAPFGDRAGIAALAAALLFAVAPWAVIHSRKVWAQDLLPPFVLLYAWLGYRAFIERRAWSLVGHGLALAVLIQIHFSALWLLPVSAAWFIACIKRVRIAPLLTTIVVFAAMFAPYLIADGLRGWPSVNRLSDVVQQPASLDASAVHLAWITTTGQEIYSLAGAQEFQNFLAETGNLDVLLIALGAAALVGLAIAVVDSSRAVRQRAWSARSAGAWMLATWLVLPIVFQISHRTPLYPHYFLILYPAQFLLIGWLIAHLARRLTWIAAAAVIVIAMVESYQVLALQQFVASRPTPGGMGIPIGYYEQISNVAKNALKENGGAEIIVNTHGSNPNSDEYPAVFDFLLGEVPHRFVDVGQPARLYPATSHVQIDYAPDEPLAPPEAGRVLVEEIPLRAGEQPGRVYRSEGYTHPPCDVAQVPARWQNGVSLLSAQINPVQPGQQATLHLCLKIDRPAAAEYHWTAQLWDKNGQRRAQVDDNGYPTRYWRADDVITQDLLLAVPADLPAGDYVLRIGQYTWPEVKPVLVIDVAGNPQSDAVEVPVHVSS